MTWEEIYQETIDKYREYYEKKIKNKEHFKQWFMEREKVGWLFSHVMVFVCYAISNKIKDGKSDHFVIIDAKEGYGKSTFSFQMAAWIYPNFSNNHICLKQRQFDKHVIESITILVNTTIEVVKIF